MQLGTFLTIFKQFGRQRIEREGMLVLGNPTSCCKEYVQTYFEMKFTRARKKYVYYVHTYGLNPVQALVWV